MEIDKNKSTNLQLFGFVTLLLLKYLVIVSVDSLPLLNRNVTYIFSIRNDF